MNLQLGSDSIYDACPYCLTKINLTDTPADVSLEESRSCHHHLGYLCEREKKTEVPDECMICKDIITCMLSALKK